MTSHTEIDVLIETILLTHSQPFSINALSKILQVPIFSIETAIEKLALRWENRGLILTCVADGWRFQTKKDFQTLIERLEPEKTVKYSRATWETLAIIAYKQPVTRGDIEAIRGVSTSSQIMRTLEERGWIESIGRRDVPGRPLLYATTTQFLNDLSLKHLKDLPPFPLLNSEQNVEKDNIESSQRVKNPNHSKRFEEKKS